MEPVVPERVETQAAFLNGSCEPRIVEIALRDQVKGAAGGIRFAVHGFGQLFQEGTRRLVDDAVDRVEAERVDMILPDPVAGVLDEEAPHVVAPGAVDVQCRTPRRLVGVAEVGGEVGQVIPLGAEVVVDDV